MSEEIKVVTIGDGSVGKTCLIKRFVENSYSPDTQSSVFDDYEKELIFEGKTYLLKIKDCGGQADAKATREQALQDNDIVVLCYSVADVNSVTNMARAWLPELASA